MRNSYRRAITGLLFANLALSYFPAYAAPGSGENNRVDILREQPGVRTAAIRLALNLQLTPTNSESSLPVLTAQLQGISDRATTVVDDIAREVLLTDQDPIAATVVLHDINHLVGDSPEGFQDKLELRRYYRAHFTRIASFARQVQASSSAREQLHGILSHLGISLSGEAFDGAAGQNGSGAATPVLVSEVSRNPE